MGLQGIKSLKEAFNYLTPDIEQFLKEEGFKEAKKSEKPKFTHTSSEVKYVKDLHRNEGYLYMGYVSGSEIIVETLFLENGEGNECFRKTYDSNHGFIHIYNQFVEWLSTTVK